MLVKFFRSSYLIQYIALIFLTAAIWIPGFLANPGLPVNRELITPLYNLAHYAMDFINIASPAVAVVIVFISALTLNNILIYHELIPKNNILPAFIFILFMGSNALSLCTYPIIIALPFLTWFIHTVFKINDDPENFMEIFNSGILVAMISMIYPAAIFLFFYVWMTMLIYGTFNGRNLVISIIALFLPYIYLFLYFFWTDQLFQALEAYRVFFTDAFLLELKFNVLQMAIWIIFAILMLLPAFYRITSTLSSFNINFRKKMAATSWLLMFSLPMIFLHDGVNYHTLIFLPATIMVANYYQQFKKSFFNEITLLIFFILVLVNNYLHYFNA